MEPTGRVINPTFAIESRLSIGVHTISGFLSSPFLSKSGAFTMIIPPPVSGLVERHREGLPTITIRGKAKAGVRTVGSDSAKDYNCAAKAPTDEFGALHFIPSFGSITWL